MSNNRSLKSIKLETEMDAAKLSIPASVLQKTEDDLSDRRRPESGYQRGGNNRRGPYPRNRGGHSGSPGRFQRDEDFDKGGRNQERILHDKLMAMMGPTFDLPPLDLKEKKFTSKGRLYIGNIPPDMTADELKEMFKTYGEVADVYLNREKHFSFISFDYQCNAARAKSNLNHKEVKGRMLKIRFAPRSHMLRVKNLDEHVSNELLHFGFSVFGELDRAVVVLDERGKPTGEGLVEFARKPSALFALRMCTENCFFLTKAIRPVLVELYEEGGTDETDGYSERYVNKNNVQFQESRSVGPRIARSDSFENEYGIRWKQLYELHKRKQRTLEAELDIERSKLTAQMEYARYEHETAMLREQLHARESNMDRQRKEWERKRQDAEEERKQLESSMAAAQQQPQEQQQLEEVRQRQQQENDMFLQAQQLSSLLDRQEQALGGGGDAGGSGPWCAEGMAGRGGAAGQGGGGGGGGSWGRVCDQQTGRGASTERYQRSTIKRRRY